MPNTPEIKTYTWEQISNEPGVYSSLDGPKDWLIVVLENKHEESDEWRWNRGDYKSPDVILMYDVELKIFTMLPLVHYWYKYTYIKSHQVLLLA